LLQAFGEELLVEARVWRWDAQFGWSMPTRKIDEEAISLDESRKVAQLRSKDYRNENPGYWIRIASFYATAVSLESEDADA
jgi:hypothetical protein